MLGLFREDFCTVCAAVASREWSSSLQQELYSVTPDLCGIFGAVSCFIPLRSTTKATGLEQAIGFKSISRAFAAL